MRVAVLAFRLPVRLRVDGEKTTLVPAVGGVATGLAGAVPAARRRWIGWVGHLEALPAATREAVQQELEGQRLSAVSLDHATLAGFYAGYSNRVLWPLFHSMPGRLPLRIDTWDAYLRGNEAFAATALHVAREDEVLWVHDYQLMLVPRLVRNARPDARIAFFLHIPFPPVDIFRLLPQRDRLLEGLLGADQIAFHTADYRANFVQALQTLLDIPAEDDVVRLRGRTIHLEVAPMGIDVAHFEELGDIAALSGAANALSAKRSVQIIAGVDRLDYTKGIPRRLLAFESLLRRYPEWREKVVLVQVAVPSRADVDEYRTFTQETDRLVGRINGAFGTALWAPIHYINRALAQPAVAALYRVARVAAVTPIRDGMNLVAKEFVATRTDEDGVLVLGELAGAASELVEALIVNPYDVDATADALHRALSMTRRERRERMRALRRRLQDNDVSIWARRLLERVPARRVPSRSPVVALPARIQKALSASHLALLLDYDGTLVPFTVPPEAALPDADVLRLLRRLARRPSTTVYVVSGRDRDFLERALGATGIGLVAEHGAWWRRPGTRRWREAVRPGAKGRPWRVEALRLLRDFQRRTPGTRIEEKSRAVAWHWRGVSSALGQLRADELAAALRGRLPRSAEVIVGDHVIEVRSRGTDKGAVVREVRGTFPRQATVVAVGDDVTDEDMFRALDERAVTIHVGARRTVARYRLPDVPAVRVLLEELAGASRDR